MNEELKRIFGNGIDVDGVNVPVEHLFYTGNADTFVTWTIISEAPALSANDELEYSICTVDVDVFSKGSYTKVANKIKKMMKEAGWLWTETSSEMYEEDTCLYHRTLTFEREVLKWQE